MKDGILISYINIPLIYYFKTFAKSKKKKGENFQNKQKKLLVSRRFKFFGIIGKDTTEQIDFFLICHYSSIISQDFGHSQFNFIAKLVYLEQIRHPYLCIIFNYIVRGLFVAVGTVKN